MDTPGRRARPGATLHPEMTAPLSLRAGGFDRLRLLAALMVLVSHSYSVATGDHAQEPLRADIGLSLGELGLDIFFVMSGYLVTRSAVTRSPSAYFKARFLRIYPASIAATFLTVGVAALWLSTMPLASFVADPLAGWHVLKNVVMVSGPAYGLPGTFVDNPYSGVVNGSLWTIALELRLYLVLGFIVIALRRMRVTPGWMRAFAACLTLTAAVCALLPSQDVLWVASARVVYMFAAGSCLWHFGFTGGKWIWIAAPLTLVAAWTRDAFLPVYLVCMPPLIIWLAHLWPMLSDSERMPADYSFGLYLYGFPVQQALIAWWPGTGPVGILVGAVLITVPLAMASWYFIERPALAKVRSAPVSSISAPDRGGAES